MEIVLYLHIIKIPVGILKIHLNFIKISETADFTPHTNLDESVRVRTTGFRLIKNKPVLSLSEVDITLVLNSVYRVSQDHVMEVVLFDVAQGGVVQTLKVVDEGEEEVYFFPFQGEVFDYQF